MCKNIRNIINPYGCINTPPYWRDVPNKGGVLIHLGVRDSKFFRACGAGEPKSNDYLSYYTIFAISSLL